MKVPNFLSRTVDQTPAETNSQVLTGAIGGVVPRITPTNVSNVFGSLAGHGMSGVSSPIAFRPPSAPMLKSATYHTQIPGVGRLLGMDTISFRRGTNDVHPAAVSDVEHLSANVGVHPSVARKVSRGNGSV